MLSGDSSCNWMPVFSTSTNVLHWKPWIELRIKRVILNPLVNQRQNLKSKCQMRGNRFMLQSGASSLAKHGGAYFSAVCGWKLIPISAPEAHEHRECCGLLALTLTITFFCFPQFALPIGCSRQFCKRISSKRANMDLSSQQFWISFVFLVRSYHRDKQQGWECCQWNNCFLKVFSQHDQDRFFISAISHLIYISCLMMFILWTHTQCFLPFLCLTYLFAHCLFVTIETG